MKRIFLIGYMGAGKTTVGKVLSERLGLSFVDLDHYIEARYHKTIGQLFTEKGEDEFRKIERKMLHEVATFEDILVSTGGGAPCFFDNMLFMNTIGQTVYLKVSVDELAKRLELAKATRPVLRGRSGNELKLFIAEMLEDRDPFYHQAGIVFNAEQMIDEQDVSHIVEALAERI